MGDLKIVKNEASDHGYQVFRKSTYGWEGLGLVEKSGTRNWRVSCWLFAREGFKTRDAAARWLAEQALPQVLEQP